MRRVQFFSLLLSCLFLMVFSANVIASPKLDANESAIVAWSESHSEDAIELLERQVNINSGSLNQEGVKEVGAILRAELDGLDFETRWVDMPEDMLRGGHLFGEHAGTQGKKILLIGHLDTVFEPDDAFRLLHVMVQRQPDRALRT